PMPGYPYFRSMAFLAAWFTQHTKNLGTYSAGVLGIFVAYNLSSILAFDHFIALDLFYTNFSLLVCAIASGIFQNVTVSREKKFIRSSFERYVSPDVVDELVANPSRLTLGGRKEMLSIFFADIRSFTSISETMEPEKLTSFL